MATFKALASGVLVVPCQEASFEAAIAREALQKKQPIKQCKAAEAKPVDLGDRRARVPRPKVDARAKVASSSRPGRASGLWGFCAGLGKEGRDVSS